MDFFLSLSFQFENFRCTRVTSFLQLDAAVTRCLDKVCAGRQATEDNSAEWLLHLQQQQQSHSELLLCFSSRSVFATSAFYPTTTNRKTLIEAPLPLPDEFTTETNKAKKADTAFYFFYFFFFLFFLGGKKMIAFDASVSRKASDAQL